MSWSWDLDAISGPPEIPGVTNLQPLGSGGMGQVFRGNDSTGRMVAVKVMHRLDPASLARFQREAELLARFRAPEVVTAHAWGVTKQCSYLICALVEGQRFDEAAEELSPEERIRLLIDAARAAGVAHRAGVVHRDLKPSNILVTSEGEVRLIDFGVSIGLDQDRMTRTGELIGTPAYLPPECLVGADPAPTADVWSLGAMGYQLLTGRVPYPVESIQDLARRTKPSPPLGSHVPRSLAAVIRRALSPEPAARFPDGESLAAALEGALAAPSSGSRLPSLLAGMGVLLVAFSVAVVLVALAKRERQPAAVVSPTPTPTPTPTSSASPGLIPPSWTPTDLAALPVVLRETFARGELTKRWEAVGGVDAELVDRGGAVCLRVVSEGDSGYVNTRRKVVKLPDMNGVQAIAVRMRAPRASAERPLPVQVVLGGKREKVLLEATARVTPAWKTFRFELKWMFPMFRAFPRAEELDTVFIRLPGAGTVEIRSIELLGGERAMRLAELLKRAFPGRSSLRTHSSKIFAVITDLDPFEDEQLYTMLAMSQSRLRQTLGPIGRKQIPLLLFKDRGTFLSFWEEVFRLHGIRSHLAADAGTGAIVNYATAVYAPEDSARLDCVEISAKAFLARNLRITVGQDWLFVGLGYQERLEAWGIDMGTWLKRGPRAGVPFERLVKEPVEDEHLWMALLLVRWLEEDERAPIRLPQLLSRFRVAGQIDLEQQLRSVGKTLQEAEAAWWTWIRETFPSFKPAK